MKKEKTKKASIEEIYLTNKEKEILDSYNDNLEEYEIVNNNQVLLSELYEKENEDVLVVEDEDISVEEIEPQEDIEDSYEETTKAVKKKNNSTKRKINIIFTILLLLILMVALDIVIVLKYDKGPYFAIPLRKYDDGGTTVYYGLGYKVIKYNQVQGRRDKELGTYRLKYNTEPVYTDAIDLAIEFNNDETKSYKKYYKKFIRVSGILTNVSKKQNSITISFYDEEEGKYDLDIICDMETEKESLNSLSTDAEISALGTMTKYKYKTKNKPATIYMSNCFAEQ